VVAVLMNPSSPEYGADLADLQHAANSIGQRISIIKASRADELLAAFEVAVQQQATALLVMTDVLFNNRRNELVLLAAQYAVPTIYFQREAVEAGGLMSYGPIIPDLYRQVGAYAGRLLKGDKPENLPVLQPTKFELAINLKTAKVLGLDIPATLLARADEVIE
jgi:putative ABC transport system substrate-binding protein